MEQGEGAGHVDWVEVTAEPISQLRVTEFVTVSNAGAVSLFLGESGLSACEVKYDYTHVYALRP